MTIINRDRSVLPACDVPIDRFEEGLLTCKEYFDENEEPQLDRL